MMKILCPSGIEGNVLSPIKESAQTSSYHHTLWRKNGCFPLRSRTGPGPALSHPYLTSPPQVLASALEQGQEIKAIQIGKEEPELSLCTSDMILSGKHPQGSSEKLLELLSELSEVTGCKLSEHRSIVFYLPAMVSWELK